MLCKSALFRIYIRLYNLYTGSYHIKCERHAGHRHPVDVSRYRILKGVRVYRQTKESGDKIRNKE